jgi:hypothetical protein
MTNHRKNLVGRSMTAGTLVLAAGFAAGCDWSLAFESGSLDIVEELICPECDDEPKNPNAEGNSPGTSTGGGGGAAEEPEGDEEAETTIGTERASAIVAGRRWGVDTMRAEIAADHDGNAVIAVSSKVSVAGVEGESTVFVPSQMWPTDADADPALFVVGESTVGARSNPSMTIGGKEYLLEFVATTARVDETPAGPRVRGMIEAHAVALSVAGQPNAKKQLVRLSFDADVE